MPIDRDATIAGHARAILAITTAEGTDMPDETELWIACLEADADVLEAEAFAERNIKIRAVLNATRLRSAAAKRALAQWLRDEAAAVES
jgi:hypothetical protein